MNEGFAGRLREARNELGLTQEALAQRLGLTLISVGRWERGEAGPRGATFINLANALNVSAAWLRTGEGPREAPEPLTPNPATVETFRAVVPSRPPQLGGPTFADLVFQILGEALTPEEGPVALTALQAVTAYSLSHNEKPVLAHHLRVMMRGSLNRLRRGDSVTDEVLDDLYAAAG